MLTFGGSSEKKKTTKDLVRQTKRDVSRSQRELDREKRKLDREEKKLIGEIKKMAKKDSSSKNVKILAKQLVQLRSQRDRLIAANANMSTIKNQATMMGTQATMTKALAQAGTAMKTANKVSVVLFCFVLFCLVASFVLFGEEACVVVLVGGCHCSLDLWLSPFLFFLLSFFFPFLFFFPLFLFLLFLFRVLTWSRYVVPCRRFHKRA